MLEEIIDFASISSHSLDITGLGKAAKWLEDKFAPLADKHEKKNLPPFHDLDEEGHWKTHPVGQLLLFSKERKQAPIQLLLIGHYDTVYKELFPIKRENDLLFGPGVADMKGGIVLMLNLLRWIESSPLKDKIGWQVALNPDEEIGSPSSGPVLQSLAKGKILGLVFEPSLPSGAVVSTRPGSKTLVIEAFGKTGHAGRDAKTGRNALIALSEALLYFSSLQDLKKGITVNPGWMRGGVAANVIPDKAVLVVNIRGEIANDWKAIEEIEKKREVQLKITEKSNRPPRHCLPQTKKYLELLGLPAEHSFGVSDSNLLEAVGLPTLDGLGPTGIHLHSPHEHLVISSLDPRLEKLKQFCNLLVLG